MDTHVLADLSAYLDQELPAVEVARVARHLEECPSCQAAYQELAAVSLVARGHFASLAPSANLSERILASIQVAEARRERRGAWATAGCLAACLLLVLGFLLSPFGVFVTRFAVVALNWFGKGLAVLAAVLPVTPNAAIVSLAAAACLLVGSVWGVRKLVTGFSTGEAR